MSSGELSVINIRLVWRHKSGETHISDDAAFAKAGHRSFLGKVNVDTNMHD